MSDAEAGTIADEAGREALSRYTYANMPDRDDADLLIAGFEDGAEWQASRKVEVTDEMVHRALVGVGNIPFRQGDDWPSKIRAALSAALNPAP